MILRARWALAAACASLLLAACATDPTPSPLTMEEQYEPETVQVPSPLVEYPPIEPVEPPLETSAQASPPAADPPKPQPAPNPPQVVAVAPPSPVAIPPAAVPAPAPPPEDVELIVLLADLQRYGSLNGEDVKREIANVTTTFNKQRSDANRVRLAVLYTQSHSYQDDQRALAFLDNVVTSKTGASPAVKQLAFVLQAQIVARQRAVREEQQRADAALQKLEALRQMERSLMRERARSGGGGGGGSGGGSGGGGGGGGQ